LIIRHSGASFKVTSLILINTIDEAIPFTSETLKKAAQKAKDFNKFKDIHIEESLLTIELNSIFSTLNVNLDFNFSPQLTKF